MSYAVVQDVPASWERYAAYAAALEDEAPAGLIVHAAGPTDEGFRTIDVWESRAAWRSFHADRLELVTRGLPRPLVSRELELAHLVVGGRAGRAGSSPRQAPASNHDDPWRSR